VPPVLDQEARSLLDIRPGPALGFGEHRGRGGDVDRGERLGRRGDGLGRYL
jgi:hypothetical protein